MVDIKNKFRATNGLDAGGEKVINVALADRNVSTDGVNVQYLIQENTIQNFSETRSYLQGFAVLNNNRIWIAKVNVVAGPFVEGQWQALRTDPKYVAVNTATKQLNSGDYITVDTSTVTSVEFTLPSNAQDGDVISIRDVGGNTGYSDLIIKAGQQSIMDRGQKLISTKMTVPYSEYLFVYMNRLWNLYNVPEEPVTRTITPAVANNYLQSGESILRLYDQQKQIKVIFPKNANHGDMIRFLGINSQVTVPYFNMLLESYDSNTSIFAPGTKSRTVYRSISGFFVFDANNAVWNLYDSDITDRLKLVSTDTVLFPNETVAVRGLNNTTTETVNLTLPTLVEQGDKITISLKYIRNGQTVKIKCSGTDKIVGDMNFLQFPKRSSYPPNADWTEVTEIQFNGLTDYPPVIELAYNSRGSTTNNYWVVVSNLPALERVDPTNDATRSRLGVIALATQDQANLDHENITVASKEVALTPETLANRTATESRRGIARIATTAQNSYATGSASYADDLIVTPKKLDAKQATETMRGLAEIATQAEANGTTDDTRIITAKKLSARQATETMKGVAEVVTAGGVQGTARNLPGTGIFNDLDHEDIVTPKTLKEFKASETQQGTGYLATSAEVIAGTPSPVGFPLLVTPEALHTKTASETRIGFAEIATQAEVNAGTDDVRFVTPKKLAGRAVTESMTGLARVGTQAEFNAGVLDNVIATPLKIKTYFNDTARTSVVTASGLVESGTVWSTYGLDIQTSSETQRGTLKLATQALTNAGVDDTTAITPKKLHAKKATESVEGIIRVANFSETVAGTSKTLAVSPAGLSNAIKIEPSWQATTLIRGTVKMTEDALTFVGNDTVGNTQSLDLYQKSGYAISPYELNKTLANYMPLKAKAVDSDLLDGLDSTQFVRRDIAQTVNGSITFAATSNTINGALYQNGLLVLGKVNDGTKDTYQTRLTLQAPTFGGVWQHRIIDDTATSTYALSYANNDIATFNSGGTVTTRSSLNVGGTLSTSGQIKSTGAIFTDSSYYISDNVVLQIGSDPANLLVGNSTKNLFLKTADANTLMVQDGTSNYAIINEKNMRAKLDPIYVNATGDTMTGRLTVNSPIVATIAAASAPISTVPTTANFGTWVTDVTASAQYNLLPGYVVPVAEINSETGLPTGFIDHYDEFKGPGTLSQFGSSATSGAGTYQMWAPRPLAADVNKDGHTAQTFYMRSWNTNASKWDGWGRVYTSNNPPTASDIGAMSDNGSVFSSLRIRDWIQVGNLRIYADPTTKSVRFDWVE